MLNRGIKIFGESLRDFNQNVRKEFFITNGLGSFSSGCINGNFSRQYHALFIRSYNSPINRYIALYKSEESILGKNLGCFKEISGKVEKIHTGSNYLYEFSQNPFPKFKYLIDNVSFEKEIIMAHNRDLIGVNYNLSEKHDFSVNLFLNFRDSHALNATPKIYDLKKEKDIYYVVLNGEKLYFYSDGEISLITEKDESLNFEGESIDPNFQKNIVYDLAIDERGETSLDSCTKVLKIKFKKRENGYFIASFEKLKKNENLEKIRSKEEKRLLKLLKQTNTKKEDILEKNLILAADSFITKKETTNGKTIIAGYPWFNDWGRDTMIAFSGLTLTTQRFEDAKSILLTFRDYCSEGMLPNNFPDSKDAIPMYNNVDGTLWYFYGIYKYLEYTEDFEFIKSEIFPTLKEIIEYHIKGTRYKIKVDDMDGLLSTGDPSTQLTWMDVKYKGVAVTPRFGKAVEVNALWYNALKIFEFICKKTKVKFEYGEYIEKIEKNFKSAFFNGEYLKDYIFENGENIQIRPNQIFVVSLPFQLLNKKEAKKVVDCVYKELFTPYGLKSLSSKDSEFIGVYNGSLYERDFAYHQGTIWSWLIGPFIEAYYKIYGNKNLKNMIAQLENHLLHDACLGSVSEIFDGEEPYKGRGCFAQAWSIGELLRVYKEIIIK